MKTWQLFAPRTRAVASFCLLLALAASGQSPSTPRFNESDIIATLESAKSREINLADVLKADGGKKFSGWDFDAKHCNQDNDDTVMRCLRVGADYEDKISQVESSKIGELALQRACAFGNRKPELAEEACSELGSFYYIRNNLDMALAVYLYAPGCQQRTSEARCLGPLEYIYSKQGDRVKEFAVVQEECSRYDRPRACQRVIELGGTADVEAARVANSERQRQGEATREAGYAQQDADRAERQRQSDQRLNATLGAIQSLGGTTAAVRQAASASVQQAQPQTSTSAQSDVYNPNRHYSGPYADQVSTLLARSSGWSCPTSISATISWSPPIRQVCMRDDYVSAAVAAAYGAECETRLGRDQEAAADAAAVAANIKSAKSMCSNAPAVANPTSGGCSTLQIVPCP